MKFNQYLNEDILEQYSDVIPASNLSLIRTRCKKYLKLINKTGPFYRGVYENLVDGELIKKSVRQNRKPMGTRPDLFKKLNNWLKKHGHVRRDKSVSAISDAWNAGEFGQPYLFFPLGKFNYTWLKATDLNFNDFNSGWKFQYMEYFFEKEQNYITPDSKKIIKDGKKEFPKYFTTNKGIEKAYKNKWEIWFDCKEYYVVNPSSENTYWADNE